MKVLVACEISGIVRDAFNRRGHEAWSCDLEHSLAPSNRHLISDVLHVLNDGWDVMIAFPPCTYLCSSGLHRNKNNPERQEKTEQALEFVRRLMAAPIKRKAIENPVGCISSRIREPEQFIQPHQYGHDASKETCLWLDGLPPLVPTQHVPPRWCLSKDGRRYLPRWANQTDSGQNRLGPSDDRAMVRGLTYFGWAEAMAEQWGRLLVRAAS